MIFKMHLICDNAAFGAPDADAPVEHGPRDAKPEVVRILRDLADKMEGERLSDFSDVVLLSDINGNRSGHAEFLEINKI